MQLEKIVVKTKEPVPKLTWRCILRPVFFAVFVAASFLIACCCLLYDVYFRGGSTHVERPVVIFVVLVWAYVAYLLVVILRNFRRAFRGEIDEKPFERKFAKSIGFGKCVVDPRPFTEVLHPNGKFYPRRLYGIEIIESTYQIVNFALYSCRMGTSHLLIYSFVMLSAAKFQLWQVRILERSIGNDGKNRENIFDMFLELFCTVYPACIIYFVNRIYFTEIEMIQLITVPLWAFCDKLKMLTYSEIVLALDDIRIKNRPVPERRKSVALRQEAMEKVEKTQNKNFGLPW